MDNTDITIETETAETPKRSLVLRVTDKMKTKTGKTILAVAGTAGALAATYVFGFKQGQDNTIEIITDLSDLDDESPDEELDQNETEVEDAPSDDSTQE